MPSRSGFCGRPGQASCIRFGCEGRTTPMIDKVVKYGTELAKTARSVQTRLKRLGRKKTGVLVYVGLHRGRSFEQTFRDYEVCYGFEANPDLFQELRKKFGKYPHVHL